jgi:hypothetical protein
MGKKLYSFRFEEEIIKKIKKLADKDFKTLTEYIQNLMLDKTKEKKK